MDTRKLLESFRQIEEDEYGRDQGAMYEPQMPETEAEFFDLIDEYGTAEEDQNYQGEGTGNDVFIKGNEVYHGPRHMGTLTSRGPNMIVMRGDYGDGEELIGAIVKARGGMDVFFYKPGYVGTSPNLKAALDTLIVAAWG